MQNSLQTYLEKNNKVLYFLHIPKTSGTAFSGYLDSQFQESQILPEKVWNTLAPRLNKDTISKSGKPLSQYLLIRGHFGHGVQNDTKKSVENITFLRDPAERTMSQYRHTLRDMEYNNWIPPYLRNESPLYAKNPFVVLSSEAGALFYGNLQSRMIGLNLNVRAIGSKKRIKPDELIYSWLNDFQQHGKTETELISLTMHNMSHFGFVGIQEYYPESTLLFAQKYGIEPQKDVFIKQMFFEDEIQKKYVLDEQLKKYIRTSLCRGDYYIYNCALEAFSEKYVAMVNELLGTKIDPIYTLSEKKRLQIYKMLYTIINRLSK